MVAVALSITALAGCRSDGHPAETPAAVPVAAATSPATGDDAVVVLPAADGSSVVVAARTEGSGEAVVGGRLAVAPAGCLGLVHDGEDVFVIWPEGTTPLEDAVGVSVPGLGQYRLGDDLSGSGAWGSGANLSLPHPVAPCATALIAAVGPGVE